MRAATNHQILERGWNEQEAAFVQQRRITTPGGGAGAATSP